MSPGKVYRQLLDESMEAFGELCNIFSKLYTSVTYVTFSDVYGWVQFFIPTYNLEMAPAEKIDMY